MAERSDEQAQVCAFCESDPEALADAHEEGWRAGREHEQRQTERIVAERLAEVAADRDKWHRLYCERDDLLIEAEQRLRPAGGDSDA